MTRQGPYARAAATYRRAGWPNPIPVRGKDRPPTGYTGADGADVTDDDVARWAASTEGRYNVALRLPDGSIGIDVDAYGDKQGATTLAAAVVALGVLPPTWSSTSRGPGQPSRIYLYRTPTGLDWTRAEANLRRHGPHVDVLHRAHRYALVAPSQHPDSGYSYRWYLPGPVQPGKGLDYRQAPAPMDLAELPASWVAALVARPEPVKRPTRATPAGSGGVTPWQDYNAKAEIGALLEDAGWAFAHRKGTVDYWRRPGKPDGHSASVGDGTDDDGNPCLYVFSTSTGFDEGRYYDAVGVYAVLHHGGDRSAACKALYEQGYGDRVEPKPRPAPPDDRWIPPAEEVAGEPSSPLPLAVVRAADVKAKRVRWLWRGYIPLGMVSVFDGHPKLGKSTVSLDITARVTTGSPMPDGTPGIGPANVIILSAEDPAEYVIRPRLDAAEADTTRVVLVDHVPDPEGARDVVLPADLDKLEAHVRAEQAVLVIVDPFVAYLDAAIDAHRDQDVRRALRGFKGLAERTGAAFLLIRHYNKAGEKNPILRGGGSIGISGAARSVLMAAEHPDDETRRVFALAGGNLGPEPPTLAYRTVNDELYDTARIMWEGPTDHHARDLLGARDEQAPSRVEAEQFLRDVLGQGRAGSSDVQRQAREAGIAAITLRRAREALGVRAYQHERRWWWALPSSSDARPKNTGDEHLNQDSIPAGQNATGGGSGAQMLIEGSIAHGEHQNGPPAGYPGPAPAGVAVRCPACGLVGEYDPGSEYGRAALAAGHCGRPWETGHVYPDTAAWADAGRPGLVRE